MIAYYARDGAPPPGAMLVDLARVLRCSTDALLGVTAVNDTLAPDLQRIEALPPADQRAVDAMLDTRRRSTPPARAKRKAS